MDKNFTYPVKRKSEHQPGKPGVFTIGEMFKATVPSDLKEAHTTFMVSAPHKGITEIDKIIVLNSPPAPPPYVIQRQCTSTSICDTAAVHYQLNQQLHNQREDQHQPHN